MATWQTDVLGTGLAHTAPTKAERVLARRIAARWKEWHPLLLHELRARPHPPGFVSSEILRLERAHARAMARLMEIAPRYPVRFFRRIRVARLDDPRLSDEERDARVRKAKGRGLGKLNRRRKESDYAC